MFSTSCSNLISLGIKQMLQNMASCKSEALQIANGAKSIRETIFKHDGYHFSGAFPPHCQQDCIPVQFEVINLYDFVWTIAQE